MTKNQIELIGPTTTGATPTTVSRHGNMREDNDRRETMKVIAHSSYKDSIEAIEKLQQLSALSAVARHSLLRIEQALKHMDLLLQQEKAHKIKRANTMQSGMCPTEKEIIDELFRLQW